MKNLILSLSLLISLPTFGQTILISDVDDTIKVSYVLDTDSVAANTPRLFNSFIGMPDLYQQIAKIDELKTIKYLSNAPKHTIGKLHEKFLDINEFPTGQLVARSKVDLFRGNAHKLNSIKRFIKEFKPRMLILIGDNGEHDAEIYHDIAEDFRGLEIQTYIRQAYSSLGHNKNFSKPLFKDQIPFVSSLDIAIDLYKKGILHPEHVKEHVLKTVPAILAEGNHEERGQPMAFPEWYDCRDFILQKIPLILDANIDSLLQQYAEKVVNRCSKIPFGK